MTPMVGEVNKIVSNLLVAGHSVAIPSVGSLHVEWRGARKVARNKIAPPYYAVVFSSQQTGHPLVDAIAREVEDNAAAAQDIFVRWLARTLQDGVLTIDGVGVLRHGEFTLDPAFDEALNPRGHVSVTVRQPSRSWPFWVLACVAMVCGVGVCGWILYDHIGFADMQQSEVVIPAVVEPVTVMLQETDSVALAVEQGVTQPETSADSLKKEITGAEQMVSGRTYIVLGVFSTEQNALRAVEAVKSDDPALLCGVYYYGSKFMVSIFESDDPAAGSIFVADSSSRFPDVWSYKAR